METNPTEQTTSGVKDFKLGIPLAILFIALFLLIQKLGVERLTSASTVNYGSAFIIGLIASISTCMAVIGGLVLSVSANYAKSGSRFVPQLYFHIGRLVSFFLFGGLIGLIGKSFVLSGFQSFILNVLIALVLLMLGIKLLDIFPWADRVRLMLPDFFKKRIEGLQSMNHTVTPLLIGIATFFLPCGFTQSMQIYSLSTGSFASGAFTMLSFALGTLPMLALLSFGSLSIQKKMQSGAYFKAAGLVVIFFGLYTFTNALNAGGFLSFSKDNSAPATSVIEGEMSQAVQIIEIDAKGGYLPRSTKAQAGIPTILRVNTSGTFDCSAALSIESLGIRENLPPSGMTEIAIPPQESGSTIVGTCQMGMYDFSIEFD